MNQSIGKLYVVATPIGNLGDISQRAQTVLSDVDWIAAEDTRHSSRLLSALNVATPLIAYHQHNEVGRADELVAKCLAGENGALISDAGTPLISDPGYRLVKAAHDAQIEVVALPGPCAVTAALSISGLPTNAFTFVGFLPPKGAQRRQRLEALQSIEHTLVVFEAPHRIAALIDDCVEVLSPQRPAALGRELTKTFESLYPFSLGELQSRLNGGDIPLKGEFVLMISGNPKECLSTDKDMRRVLQLLLPEMPLKQAVRIATELTGIPKNALYECAVALKEEK